jgi:hypothetical protein
LLSPARGFAFADSDAELDFGAELELDAEIDFDAELDREPFSVEDFFSGIAASRSRLLFEMTFGSG